MRETDRAVTAEERHSRRRGLVLFAIYAAVYGLFMVLAAFFPEVMAKRLFGRVNVAITYGFALIFGAFFLSLLYLVLAKGKKS